MNFNSRDSINLNNDLIINNNLSINSSLYSYKNAIFNNNVTIGNSLSVANDTIIQNDSTIFSSMNISDFTIIQGNSTINTSLYVSSQTTINGDVTIKSNLTINNSTNIQGNLTVLSDLGISGNTIIQGNIVLGDPNLSSKLNLLGQVVNYLPHYNTNLLAALAGIPEWGFYRTGGIVKIRLGIVIPVINLIGGNTNSIRVGNPYIDPGAVALDEDNNNVIPYLTSIIDSTQKQYLDIPYAVSTTTTISTTSPLIIDTYILTYTATDYIGNIGTITKTLNITP